MTDVVAGMGEVGRPLLNLLAQHTRVYGHDVVPTKVVHERPDQGSVEMLHVCFPYAEAFLQAAREAYAAFVPQIVIIHSTVRPGTTRAVQDALPHVPVIYSPVRGVHRRMEEDLRRYTKFCASFWPQAAPLDAYEARIRGAGMQVARYSSPLTLEYAKLLCDTTYYGWLIVYAQRTKMVCDRAGLDYDELWRFAEEVHQALGNRPKMFPGGGIGGHCVLPNLNLLDDEFFKTIAAQDRAYRQHLGAHQK